MPLRPGIDPDAPGGPTMDLIDPFSNVLRFCQPEGTLSAAAGYTVPG